MLVLYVSLYSCNSLSTTNLNFVLCYHGTSTYCTNCVHLPIQTRRHSTANTHDPILVNNRLNKHDTKLRTTALLQVHAQPISLAECDIHPTFRVNQLHTNVRFYAWSSEDKQTSAVGQQYSICCSLSSAPKHFSATILMDC
jgi:hypothetical protein